MAKLNREQKIEIYFKRKNGNSLAVLSMEYGINQRNIDYLIRLIDAHGFDVLRKNKNRYYSPQFKTEVIHRILINNESMTSVAIELGLSSSGIISNWIRKYKENGYNVVEKKRGRKTMTKPKKTQREHLTAEEKIKQLEEKLLYMEAENEYLKKLNVVVKQRVEREKKKK